MLGLLAVGCLLASLAYAAANRRYRGRTSQHERISLRVSGGFVTKFDYHVLDSCPGGTLLRNHDFNFPPMRIHRSRFGGRFVDAKVATAIIKGRVSRGSVSGKLVDRVRDKQTRKLCHGRATFKLKHR
jgi:hypothetical protein